jgi:ABC-type antimicrobial peptide transport system permease subunit
VTVLCQSPRSAGRAFTLRHSQFRTKEAYCFLLLAASPSSEHWPVNLAYAVSRRTQEIGIRMAIGATQGQVLGSVVRSAVALIGTGLVLGLGLALFAGRLLERILYGVKRGDPASFAIVFALMFIIGSAATFLPARRAIRIDPTQALRQE